MRLFTVEQAFTAADEHTHKGWSFNVPEGVDTLTVSFAFWPEDDNGAGLEDVMRTLKRDAPYRDYTENEARRFLPLRNHFGLSLDSPSGWVGTVHRHDANQRHTVGKNSSYGFKDIQIESGEWGLTLSLNGVVTDSVNVRVTVEGNV